MLHIELSSEEQRILNEVLEEMLPKLDVEIHRTDKLEFKQALTQRRRVLRDLLARMADEPVAAR